MSLAPYGQSKYAAEGYCDLYARLFGLSTISLRYGNVYGPRQDVHGEAGVVAIFCGRLLFGGTPQVFGDGRQTRDWVDVADVVAANLLAADSELVGPVNIGHGEETSVLDLLEVLAEVGREKGLEARCPGVPARPPRRGQSQPPRCVARTRRPGLDAEADAARRAPSDSGWIALNLDSVPVKVTAEPSTHLGKSPLTVSVVIPCLNEEENIVQCVKRRARSAV